MWKLVLKQMWNRKRSNTWIAIELLLVFCLTWYIVDYLFVISYNYQIPNYRDVEHTLQINLAEFKEEHPEYIAQENEPEQLMNNYRRILNTLRNYPGIDAIGVSFDSSTPGGDSYRGRGFYNINDTTLGAGGQSITIAPEEDYFKVFRFSIDNGKKIISTNDFEWILNGIILSRSAAQILFPDGRAIGQKMSTQSSDIQFSVIGVVDDNKRFDFLRPQIYFYSFKNLNADNVRDAEISIRYNGSLPDNKFCEQFKTDMGDALRIGNFYLLSIIPYTKIGQDTTKIYGVDKNIKIHIYLMIFFLVCIFLCVMGTFWYRISLRPNEIGLRKAIGATRMSIHYSFTIEGIWLLLIITLPAMLIEYQFVHADLIGTIGRQGNLNPEYLPDRTFIRFIITNAITFFFLMIIIISAIWLPAQKGASLPPTEALHYE